MFFKNLFHTPQAPESNPAPKRSAPYQLQLLTEDGLISNGREAWTAKARKGTKNYDIMAACIYNDTGSWKVIEATASIEDGPCKDLSISKLILYRGNVCFFIQYTFRGSQMCALITCTRNGNQIRFSKMNLSFSSLMGLFRSIEENRSLIVDGNHLYCMAYGWLYCFDFVTGQVTETNTNLGTHVNGIFYYNGYLYTGDSFTYDKAMKVDPEYPENTESFDLTNFSLKIDSRMYPPYQWGEDNIIYKNRIYSRKDGDRIHFLDLNTMEYYQQLEAVVFLGMAAPDYLLMRENTDTNQVVRGYSLYDLEINQRILFEKQRFQCDDPKASGKKVMISVKNAVYVGNTVIFFYTKGKRVKEVFYSAMPFSELIDGTSCIVDFEIGTASI